MIMQKEQHIEIEARTRFFDLHLKELLQYRDLIWIFFKKNYSTRYKQTILGPAWLIISPLFTIITYTIIFGGIAGLSTDEIPQPLFYLAGNIFWCLFSDCLNGTANTFAGNAEIFGKVYFPRLVIPISNVLTSCADFGIRLLLMMIFVFYYFAKDYPLFLSTKIWILPLLMLQVCLLGMGLGILISALTIKYRDLQVFVEFGMQIWMYATPVIYSTSMVPGRFRALFMLNPVTPAVLIFKNIFFNTDSFAYQFWGISWIVTGIILFAGIVIFNQVEKNFVDTV